MKNIRKLKSKSMKLIKLDIAKFEDSLEAIDEMAS
jgi:hypothetical protein